tara:strand:+ start:780 stop:1025 length:246 start_codon:yes stop_codon:yes gene_type:complete
MTKTFTYDDVIRYIYAETSPSENVLILEAMALNDDLMSFYLDTQEIKLQMNKIVCAPSDKTISGILKYAEQFATELPEVSY